MSHSVAGTKEYALIHKIKESDNVKNIKIVEIHPGLDRHIYRKENNNMNCYCFVLSLVGVAKKFWNITHALEAYKVAFENNTLDKTSTAGREGCGTIPKIFCFKKSTPFVPHASSPVASSSSSSISPPSVMAIESGPGAEELAPSENGTKKRKRRKKTNNGTGYRGVCKVGGRYKVTIYNDRKLKYLGMFGSAKEGAIAYDKEAMKYPNLQHCLNFPPNGVPLESEENTEGSSDHFEENYSENDSEQQNENTIVFDKKRRLNTRNTTGYTGVSKVGKRHKAQICIDGKTEYIGTFATALDAAKAYDLRAIHHGSFSIDDLNFPEDMPDIDPSYSLPKKSRKIEKKYQKNPFLTANMEILLDVITNKISESGHFYPQSVPMVQ
jgi:hypothetical protein